jgi:hypothetical protein
LRLVTIDEERLQRVQERGADQSPTRPSPLSILSINRSPNATPTRYNVRFASDWIGLMIVVPPPPSEMLSC